MQQYLGNSEKSAEHFSGVLGLQLASHQEKKE